MMNPGDRKSVIIISAICVLYVIAAVILMSPHVRAKNSDLSASESQGDKDIAESGKIDLRAVFDDSTASGMPCDNPEQFERWLETYEQETSEEDADEASNVEMGEEMGRYPNRQEEIEAENLSNTQEMETAQSDNVRGTSQSEVVYSVNGEVLNPELQAYLYQRLADHHIEWFMPYAVMMAYQESHFDCTAVNQSNLRDMGLFQFRINYYPGQDIFNPYEQIDIFTEQMANRANSGRTVSEMISAHNVSDYGVYNQTYVDQVLSHSNNLREVK